MYNLVFFVLILSSCGGSNESGKVSLIMEDGRSTGLLIPQGMLVGIGDDVLDEDLKIRLKGEDEGILGEYSRQDDGVKFKPLIAFTPGSHYEILLNGRVISVLTIPEERSDPKPSLIAVYPTADTLPENLLKIYLKFSKPMRQDVSEKYLAMLNSQGDTVSEVFLNLNTELWDEEGKVLTVWLDPGRIKRGLKPNKQEGTPLRKDHIYHLSVSASWPDSRGNKMVKAYTKTFIAGTRDTLSPDPALWKLGVPVAGTQQALTVDFNEPLDYALISNTIMTISPSGEQVQGKISVSGTERSLIFKPSSAWTAGNYILRVDTRLEDLAGNNLNRLFDRDILKGVPAGKSRFYSRTFRIIN